MIAAVTSTKSARWDHRALRPKSRVVGINISSRARTGASAASRARMRWENQRREPDLAADRVKYLQPEPLLQDPMYLQGTAVQGQSVPAYAYAFNNPIDVVDEDGLKGKKKTKEDPVQKCLAEATRLYNKCKSDPDWSRQYEATPASCDGWFAMWKKRCRAGYGPLKPRQACFNGPSPSPTGDPDDAP